LGHLFKIISFALIYPALVDTGIRRPLEILYRDLAESEGKFRGFFNVMSKRFAFHKIMRDDEGNAVDYRILDVNPAFEEILSIPAADVINKESLTGAGGYLYLIDTEDMSPDTVRHLNGLREQLTAIQRKNEFSRDYQNMGIDAPTWQSPEQILDQYRADHKENVVIGTEMNLPATRSMQIRCCPAFLRISLEMLSSMERG